MEIKDNERKSYWLILGIICSILLLSIFMYLQSKESKILALEGRWLAAAGIPLFIGLIAGGYIYKFKGFGIELETLLKNPIGEINLIATDVLGDIPGDDKKSRNYLHSLSPKEKAGIQRLSFVSKQITYFGEVIIEYIQELPKLEYLEVKKPDGTFIYLLPIKSLMDGQDVNEEKVNKFTEGLKEDGVPRDFEDDVITDFLKITDSVVKILPEVRSSQYGVLPVLSEKKILAGIITTQSIEKRIADEVVAAYKRA